MQTNINPVTNVKPPFNVYNGVVTVPVSVVFGQLNNASTPKYFTGSPVLKNRHIKGITVDTVLGSSQNLKYIYFTFYDYKSEQLVTNLPAKSIESNFSLNGSNKFPGFNLYDIDILSSFYIYTEALTWIVTGTLFNINFYY